MLPLQRLLRVVTKLMCFLKMNKGAGTRCAISATEKTSRLTLTFYSTSAIRRFDCTVQQLFNIRRNETSAGSG